MKYRVRNNERVALKAREVSGDWGVGEGKEKL